MKLRGASEYTFILASPDYSGEEVLYDMTLLKQSKLDGQAFGSSVRHQQFRGVSRLNMNQNSHVFVR